jgi:hypothetical protein
MMRLGFYKPVQVKTPVGTRDFTVVTCSGLTRATVRRIPPPPVPATG